MCFFCAVASAQRWCFIRWERCPLCLWHHGWSGQESLGWPWSGGDRRAVPVRSSSNTHLRSRRTTAYVHHDNNIFIHTVYVWECNGIYFFSFTTRAIIIGYIHRLYFSNHIVCLHHREQTFIQSTLEKTWLVLYKAWRGVHSINSGWVVVQYRCLFILTWIL